MYTLFWYKSEIILNKFQSIMDYIEIFNFHIFKLV